MLDRKEIFDIAKKYYKEKGESRLSKAYEYVDSYIIYSESSKNRIGVSAIRINKKDGSISLFSLPSKENFEILKKSTEIKL
mgnify:CR=1 FL=1